MGERKRRRVVCRWSAECRGLSILAAEIDSIRRDAKAGTRGEGLQWTPSSRWEWVRQAKSEMNRLQPMVLRMMMVVVPLLLSIKTKAYRATY